MADILIQFHALPDEVESFVSHVVDQSGLFVVAVAFPPYKAWPLARSDLHAAILDAGIHRLAFTLTPPVIPIPPQQILDTNPGALVLDLERPHEGQLAQSALSARTDDTAALAVWRKAAKQLKLATLAGALVTNRRTGDSVPAREFRSTAGVRERIAQGIVAVQVHGGNNIVTFPE